MNLKYIIVFLMVYTLGISCLNTNIYHNLRVETAEERYNRIFNQIVAPEHVDVIEAMICVESKGDTLAVSRHGDYGILQVNRYFWSKNYDFSRMNELEYGLNAGYEIYLLCYKRAHGNVRRALRFYNGSWAYANRVLSRK